MGKKRPIYYDTETTGLKADKDRIIEIAAFDPVKDKTFVSFVNPGISIPAESTAICNITNEMVEGAPSFAEVGASFVEFCAGDIVLIAHNGDAFDMPFLKHEFKRNALELPNWPSIDTLKWARKYRPDLPRHSLQYIREAYGIESNQAHRALDDVIVLHKIFSQMADDLSMETIMTLLSAPPPQMQCMPFGKHQGEPLNKVPKNYLRWLESSGALDKNENDGLKQSLVKQGLIG